MSIRKSIPNSLTALNLVCGCLSLHFTSHGMLDWAGMAIMAAAVFDFTDGFAARLLKVKSELGKQLDSLADVVSFGVAPGAIMFNMMLMGNKAWNAGIPLWVFALALMLPVCAALRLAKFNIDERQHDSFIGLPSPAAGLAVASLGILIFRNFESPLFPFNDYVLFFVLHPVTLFTVCVSLSLLMLSPLPLFAMKFKSAAFRPNAVRYIFMIASFLLLLLFFFTAVPIIILAYIATSLIIHLINRKKQYS